MEGATHAEKRKKILIVEDEKDIGEALFTITASEGYMVYMASNGEEGLRLALEHHPDLILLDLLMPIMDGQTMLKHLRADEWGKTAKVIVLTASKSMKDMSDVLEQGGLEYMMKGDWKLEEVVSRINQRLAE